MSMYLLASIMTLLLAACNAPATPQVNSISEKVEDTQDDIVYVDDETKRIAMVLSMARAFLSEKDPHYQELMTGSVEDSADILKNEDVRGKFIEVVKYMRQSDKEQVRKLCDEIEAEYVTKYSWKRDS